MTSANSALIVHRSGDDHIALDGQQAVLLAAALWPKYDVNPGTLLLT